MSSSVNYVQRAKSVLVGIVAIAIAVRIIWWAIAPYLPAIITTIICITAFTVIWKRNWRL